MKKLLLFILVVLICLVAYIKYSQAMTIGAWQNQGINIGAWQKDVVASPSTAGQVISINIF